MLLDKAIQVVRRITLAAPGARQLALQHQAAVNRGPDDVVGRDVLGQEIGNGVRQEFMGLPAQREEALRTSAPAA